MTQQNENTLSESQRQLNEAQALLGKNAIDEADTIVATLLRSEPTNVEAQYTRAVIQRVRHQWHAALTTIASILEQKPRFGRAHQEAGYNYIALEDFMRAGAAFEKAVSCDPALINSWKSLAQLHKNAKRDALYRRAQKQVDYLLSLPNELLTVISYMSEDRLLDAERLCRYFLQSNKTHIEGMRLLAEIATRNRVFEDAEFLLESCVEFDPKHRNARIQYANILLRTQKFEKAHDVAKALLDDYPDDDDTILALFASACSGVGKNAAAIVSYQKLAEAHPENHTYPVSLAHIHKTEGNVERSVELYQQAYRLKADHGDAYWSLANTKSYVFTDAEVEKMVQLESDDALDVDDRIQIRFALGKAFEDRHDFAQSFGYYASGNAAKKDITHHHEKPLQIRVEAQIDVCTAELFAERSGVGAAAADPIFIVGLPRAGSTLLEQILSSHSQVDGTMELHNILNLAKRLRGRDDDADGKPRYPAILPRLEHDYFRRFGEQFIGDTQPYRHDAPFFIDKMPNNFFHVGLIKLILPNAKIIDARRHPMGCCFSGFKQLFGEGQEFSYSLRDIGNYYRQYVRLMDHWDDVLPEFVLCVHYEDVIADLPTQVERMLSFCGLPFEDACLEFHKTERSIRTPSAEQVRQPIYTSGLDQWRNFEPWLDELKAALGDAVLARYPIDWNSAVIISHKHRFIFFAVPKTATHAIREALRTHLDDGDWEQQVLFGEQAFPIPQIAAIKHGHISARQLRPHINEEIWENYFKFAFVRNPFDRYVSTCFFLNRNNPRFGDTAVAFMKTAIGRPQFRARILVQPQWQLLSDASGLALDFVGRYETLQQSYDNICAAVGLTTTDLSRKNASRHARYDEYYDADLRRQVADFYADDFTAFDYDPHAQTV